MIRKKGIGILLFGLIMIFSANLTAQEIVDAIRAGNLERVKSILEREPVFLNGKSPSGETILFAAVRFRQVPIIEYLISEGADVKATNRSGSTVLNIACGNGLPLDAVRLLIDKGADVNSVAKYQGRPLDTAEESGNAELMEYLKSRGAQFSPREFEVHALSGNIHRIAYPWGMRNNIVVFSGPDGILVIDTGFRKTSVDAIKAEIGRFAAGEVVYLVNTHSHWDHVRGNGILSGAGRRIHFKALEGDSLKDVIQRTSDTLTGRTGRQLPAPYRLNFNGEEIQFILYPGLHSDEDVLIYFPKSGMLCMGDLLLSQNCPALSDVNGYMELLDRVLDVFPEGTTYVSGHGKDLTGEGLRKYKEDLSSMNEIVREAYAAGKKLEDMIREDILKDFKAEYSFLDWLGPDFWMRQIVSGLQQSGG